MALQAPHGKRECNVPHGSEDRQTLTQRKKSQRDLSEAFLNFEGSVFLMRKSGTDSSVWYEQFHRIAVSDNVDGFCSDGAGKQPQSSITRVRMKQ